MLGISTGRLGCVLDGAHTARERLVSEERVQNDLVERTAAQRKGVRAERDDAEFDVLVEVRVQAQRGVAADRAVMTHDAVAAKQSAHHVGEVLHLRRCDLGHAESPL